ncbi:MAG: aspartate--tRNA ligase [Fimbriimonadaceae bacterium]|nr:aspartate--tRNA ligase [Fimbriimonadaceae bacterium]
MRRTHRCGSLRAAQVGETVCVMGWVHSRRDHGGVIFLDIRDRTGLVQVVGDPQRGGAAAHQAAEGVRAEYVVAAVGEVVHRGEGLGNPRIATGEIEIVAREITVLNTALHPPFEIDQEEINLEQRMRYRYIDLRRPVMQANLELRHKAAMAARQYLSSQDFLEIETPLLLKATPEGARDFLVPCRLVPGTYYVLPQSPQLMKQTLMAAGCDRYFQLARCLRDEDLRADRQPEHTQIDLEMSFVEQDDVLTTVEGLMQAVFAVAGIAVAAPFPRLSYGEAMERYGSDKPDTRFGMELIDLSATVASVEFRVFADALASGGQVKGLCVPAKGQLSRKDLDDLIAFSKQFGAKGMAWIAVDAEGLRSSILKFIPEDVQRALVAKMGAQPGDMLLFVADRPKVVADVLGRLRLRLGHQLGLVDKSRHNFLWVIDFPLFEKNAESGAIEPMHHPFSMPRAADIPLLESDPLAVTAQLYDLVVNGAELCSGSIRCHIPDLQLKILEVIGIDRAEALERFGFLLEVFSYGAPPHGGVGLGFDRIVAILSGQEASEVDIREVIAFPKTSTGRDLMLGCPSVIDPQQLKEVGILKTVDPAAE